VSTGSGPSSEVIREAIDRHLRTNPAAADTAHGIAVWWLLPQGVEVPNELLVEVLESMAASEELRARELPDGEVLYERGPRFAAP
jgi:hypothetical protein